MKIIFLIMIYFMSLQADYIRDDTNNIIVDTTTKLVWQDNTSPSTMDWTTAISYCEALSLGSFSDWRLANITEMASLVDFTRTSPSINSKFQNIYSSDYWTSTTTKGNTSNALYVNFVSGNHDKSAKTITKSVRCVRAGQ